MKLSKDACDYIERGTVVVHVLAGLQVPPGVLVPQSIQLEIAQYMQELRIPLHECAGAAALSLLEADGVRIDPAIRNLNQA